MPPRSKKSLITGLLLALGAGATAYFLFAPTSDETSPAVAVVRTYYETNKNFDGEGAEHDQLKQIIAPAVWDCIEQGFAQAKKGEVEFGPTEVLLDTCGLHENGFYQDPYPITAGQFKIVTETPQTADIEVTFPDAPQESLRYALGKSEGTWKIFRSDRFGHSGAPEYKFPAEVETIVRAIPDLVWQWIPTDQYWYLFPADPNGRSLEGTSLFARSETATFSDAFAAFDPALTKVGWQQDLDVAADGVGGSILGYKRQVGDELQHLIFSNETTYLTAQSQNKSPSCPCLHTNKVFFAAELN